MDPVAAGGFASAAPTYARIRPAYARGAIGRIRDRCPRGAQVLDVAAGTGILSGQLHRAGLRVTAVEPVQPMLAHLVRTLPAVAALRGTAEALPVRDGRFDVLSVGEAFHWFDADAALAEAWRVLRPDGILVLLWNRRDDAVEWVARYDEIVLSERPEGRPYDTSVDWDAVVERHGGFVQPELVRIDNPRASGPRELVERAASTSFVADAAPVARDRVLERVGELVRTHPDLAGRGSFELPYVTELRTWVRR